MAQFEKIIPFIFHFAAGVPSRYATLPLRQQFDIAKCTGWSNDPDDPGGATMIDVTINTYASYRRSRGIANTTETDLRNISFDEWEEILKTRFWNIWKADRIESQGIAHMLVDWVWASGPKTIRNAQRIIGVKADGIVGEKTLSAINRENSAVLFRKLYEARCRYYRQCRGAWKYLKGWLRRLDAIRPDGSFTL